MKKILSLFIALLLLLSVGCAAPQEGDDPSETLEESGSGAQNPPYESSGEWTPTEEYTPGWYLSETLQNEITPPEVPEELSGYVVRVPRVYEETHDGVLFRVEFFHEYYPLGSLIQVRIQLQNNTGKEIVYGSNSLSLGCFCSEPGDLEGQSKSLYWRDSILDPGRVNGEDFYFTCVSRETEFPAGETFTYERVYVAEPSFFTSESSHVFRFSLFEAEAGMNRFIEVPISVVKLPR